MDVHSNGAVWYVGLFVYNGDQAHYSNAYIGVLQAKTVLMLAGKTMDSRTHLVHLHNITLRQVLYIRLSGRPYTPVGNKSVIFLPPTKDPQFFAPKLIPGAPRSCPEHLEAIAPPIAA